jgi:predicted enzyme related to lactoylglutathione lyase
MSNTMSPTAGRIVWFELPAKDTKRAQDFYSRLFGWTFEPYEGPAEYHFASEAGGAIMPASSGAKGPVVYFGVDDIEAATKRVRELGGTVGGRRELPNMGVYVHCEDTESNPFSLWQSTGSRD